MLSSSKQIFSLMKNYFLQKSEPVAQMIKTVEEEVQLFFCLFCPENLEHEAEDLEQEAEDLEHEAEDSEHEAEDLEHEAEDLEHEAEDSEHEAEDFEHDAEDLEHEAEDLEQEAQNVEFEAHVLVDSDDVEIETQILEPQAPVGDESCNCNIKKKVETVPFFTANIRSLFEITKNIGINLACKAFKQASVFEKSNERKPAIKRRSKYYY